MKKIGIFPGSFNPVHIGHLALANYILEYSDLDEIWMMVSPHNPLKEADSLCPENHRFNMLSIALKNDSAIKPSDFEFSLEKPNYTIYTLNLLQKNHPDYLFTLIIGGDNWDNFHKWHCYKDILRQFSIIVYPRTDKTIEKKVNLNNVNIINAPLMDISSTMLRNSIKQNKKLHYFYPAGVYKYIQEHNLYL